MVGAVTGNALGAMGRRAAGVPAKSGGGGAAITSFVGNVVSGTAPPYALVSLYANSTFCGSTIANAQGAWSINNAGAGAVTFSVGVASPLLQAVAYSSFNPSDIASGMTLSSGNRKVTAPAAPAYKTARGLVAHTVGKWYWEVTIGPSIYGTNTMYYGIEIASQAIDGSFPGQYSPGNSLRPDGYYWNNGGNAQSSYSAVAGDTIMMALDLSGNNLFFGKNGSWFGTANPAAGTGSFSGVSAGNTWLQAVTTYGPGDALTINNGGQPFVGAVPSGFLPWG